MRCLRKICQLAEGGAAMIIKPFAVRCAWKACLAGKPGKFTAVLYVWSVKEDPLEHKPSQIEVKGHLFCEYCARNREADAILRQYDKLWDTIRRGFAKAEKSEPNPETVQVKYRGQIQVQLPRLQ